VSGSRTSELVILWFCRMGIGVWSFCITFLYFVIKREYIVMYEGGFVLLHRTIPWWFACLYVSRV